MKNNESLLKYKNCRLCERKCSVNRFKEKGLCRSYTDIVFSAAINHSGEEPCISGRQGSGTLFFGNCNLKCIFCQNYTFSQLNKDTYTITVTELAKIMQDLINKNVHNLNLVSPTHFFPSIALALKSLDIRIPVINNTNTYESEELLEFMNGIIDIHLADFKYASDESSIKYSSAPDYFNTVKRNLKIMYKSVGKVKLENDVMKKGIIIRHLVMPGLVDESKIILQWLNENFGNDIIISLMSQYHPVYKSKHYPELNRYLSKQEYDELVEYAIKLDMDNIYIQELNPVISKIYLGG